MQEEEENFEENYYDFEKHIEDYLVIYDILPSHNILDIVRVFEHFGKIQHIWLIGKTTHVGRAFILYEDKEVNNTVLDQSGYFNVTKPEFEKMISNIKVKSSPVLVTPISDKELFLLRRKLRSSRNKNLLNVGNISDESIYPGEAQERSMIINERNNLFYGDARYIVSKKTLHFYNCSPTIKSGVLRQRFTECIRDYQMQHPNDEISNAIDANHIRIRKLVRNEDNSVSITYSHHAYAMAALLMLNGSYHFAQNFRPIIHFELKLGSNDYQPEAVAKSFENIHGDELPDIPLFG